ncbi:MAG: Hsp70 family protein [Spirulina sp. SIO3F2]|nr:Hsp70 family protein [Spirulina sp. SIO3F2]
MPLAIDFGTSNTAIAQLNAKTQQAQLLKLPDVAHQLAQNPPLIPSLLYVEDAQSGQVLLGQQVRDRGLDLTQDPRFFRGFKRGIGAQVQGFLPELDGQTLTFEQVGNWFLGEIFRRLPSESLDSLVLTVPVDSFEAYRLWLTQASSTLPVQQLQLLDEPTAAALGYGDGDADVLLVIDFGGGTVDLSLVQLNTKAKGRTPTGFIIKWGAQVLGDRPNQKARTAQVLAKVGQSLGGNDIDGWLVDHFAQTQNLPQSALTLRLAERLKIQLSRQRQATEVYFNDETLESYSLSLEQAEFEEILKSQSFFDQLDDLMSQVLQRGRLQGIEKRNIDAVLLVGGTTQLPAVRTWVERYFAPEKIRAEKPFTAIASGALQLAQGYTVQDFLYHSYGIRYWHRRDKCHRWHPIIQAGQAYPMAEPYELLLGASVENQPSVELIIGELGTQTSSTEVYFDGDRLITRRVENGQDAVKPLNDREGARTLAQLSPLGAPGSDRLKLQFRVDDQCCLRLTVEDLLTQETLQQNVAVAELK